MVQANPHYPSREAKWLREKIPAPLLIISVIVMPLAFYGILGGFYDGNFKLAGTVLLCLGLPWLFLYTNGTGLKLAWDEERVYMRPQSFAQLSWRKPWLTRLPWRSLAYDEIASLDALTVNDPAARSLLLPFQLLRLTAKGTDDEYDERHIWLYSLALRDKELAPLLHQLDAKCPNMLPDIVHQRLAKWEAR
jgi:hypothetical protein